MTIPLLQTRFMNPHRANHRQQELSLNSRFSSFFQVAYKPKSPVLFTLWIVVPTLKGREL